jgi:bifunctional DNA-binding transcriptional regulator/antitoxin component of YhaV-PrlF toxin-antitoxin module
MLISVSRKEQVTIPIALRRKYGLKAGKRVTIDVLDSGVFKIVPKLEDAANVNAEKYV